MGSAGLGTEEDEEDAQDFLAGLRTALLDKLRAKHPTAPLASLEQMVEKAMRVSRQVIQPQA